MKATSFDTIDRLCVDAIRFLAVDMVERAASGHPGMPMGAAPMAYVLWQRHLRHDPADPSWPDRDRFVLSAGHGSALLYALLHLYGYELSIDDLRSFRQWGSRTPGHPERHITPGVEATTGPLGQGIANAVGMAIAERAIARQCNRPGHDLADHRTYAIVSDGDLMEGVSAEASSLAGHIRLGRLIVLYDANDVSLDGPISLTFTEDVARRYEAYGWHVLRVEDGDRDLDAIDAAIVGAKESGDRPSLVIARTTIGYGSPSKQGTAAAHGSPLGAEEVAAAKRALGWPEDRELWIPEEARARFAEAAVRGGKERRAWLQRLAAYATAHPDAAREWDERWDGRLPEGWDAELPRWESGRSVSTRVAGGEALDAIARRVPWLIGGDADLSSSTKTALKGEASFDGATGEGRNLRFGVREHAMGAIANGIACHGGLRAYTATFFCFSDYMRPPVRLAALSGLPVVFVWTHDSVAVGEDGPTHQPVEHLASLRALPGLYVVRPCDANETAEAWRLAMERGAGPTALILSRQNLPVLDRSNLAPADGLRRGAYVLYEPPDGPPQAILIATGSEVALALQAVERLAAEGIRVRLVSMPCWEAFERQSETYRDRVLPPSVGARVSLEAGATFGWHRWVGSRGLAIGIDRFGASAPEADLLEGLGLTPERIAAALREQVRGDGEGQ